jgi:hypothetical protein
MADKQWHPEIQIGDWLRPTRKYSRAQSALMPPSRKVIAVEPEFIVLAPPPRRSHKPPTRVRRRKSDGLPSGYRREDAGDS